MIDITVVAPRQACANVRRTNFEYSRYRPAIATFLVRQGVDSEQAEDVAQGRGESERLPHFETLLGFRET